MSTQDGAMGAEGLFGRGIRKTFAGTAVNALLLGALALGGAGDALLAPSVANAHGEHGDAAPALQGRAIVQVAGYEVELLSNPAPPVAGRSVKVVAAVREAGTGRAPTGGLVLIGLAPAPPPEPIRPAASGHASHESPAPQSPIPNPQSAIPIMVRASEESWAGNYAVQLRPDQRGPHTVRVEIRELDGRRINRPAVVEFSVEVTPPPPLVGATMLWLALVAGGAAAGGWVLRARARLGVADGARLNLLQVPWVRRALAGPWLQPALQVPLLLLTALLVLVGFGDTQEPARNLTTKLTWTIWWAGIIFTFVFAGRAWCYVCPYGGLNDWAERLARPARLFPKRLRTLWPATAMFLLLTWADEQLGVVRSPVVTAWILILLAVLAVGAGLLYQRRSFCRYLCPIGGVIGLYSMLAPVELRAASGEACRTDKTKACYRGSAHSYGCPMFEFPQVMDRNTYCTLCMECVKGCPLDNMALRARPFGTDLWASAKRQFDEAYLAAAMMGVATVVTAAMIGPWHDMVVALGRLLPVNPIRWMRPITYLAVMDSLVFFGVALALGPGLVLGAAWLAEGRVPPEKRLGLRRAFTTFAYAVIPLALAMHLAHNLEHLLVEGPGIIPVIQRTAARFLGLAAGDPDWRIGALVAPDLIPWFQFAVLLALFGLGLVAAHRITRATYEDPLVAARAAVPLFVLLALVTAVNIVILAQPMGARHAM
jgi:polyferredoxin